MLYDRWSQVATEFAREIAVVDLATNQSWTFSELRRETDRRVFDEPIAFPAGHGIEFLIHVAAAWRMKRVVCPLELNQARPVLGELPGGIQHVKITSATSGPPKIILFRDHQLIADARNIVSTMNLRKETPNIGAISIAHSYGFSNLVLPLFLMGIPLVLVPAPLPELIKKAAGLFKAVTLPGVPALWRTWQEADAIAENISLGISAGAPLPLALEELVLSRRGLKIHNFYGSSECGGIAYDRSEALRTEAAYAGTAMENVSLTVSPESLLSVCSEAVGETYWPEAEPSLGRGRFDTSDLADLIDDRLYLRGRAGEYLNVAGRKISPGVIEEALARHPLVAECVVFGIPDPDSNRMERMVACIHLRGTISGPELAAFLSRSVPAWQIPREWWFSKTPLSNQRGKVPRSEWRQRYLTRTA